MRYQFIHFNEAWYADTPANQAAVLHDGKVDELSLMVCDDEGEQQYGTIVLEWIDLGGPGNGQVAVRLAVFDDAWIGFDLAYREANLDRMFRILKEGVPVTSMMDFLKGSGWEDVTPRINPRPARPTNVDTKAAAKAAVDAIYAAIEAEDRGDAAEVARMQEQAREHLRALGWAVD